LKTMVKLSCVILVMAACSNAWAEDRGIVGKPAPEWGVDRWLNLPEGKTTIDVSDYRNKVLYLYCFQSWCPGCHQRGFPTLQKMIRQFRENDDVAFVAVQTVFEGFSSNTFDRAREIAKQYSLEIPIGQSGEQDRPSELMGRYRTGGTPWVIIVDRGGVVRFNDFHIGVPQATQMIGQLLQEEKSRDAPVPQSRSGRELIGRQLDLAGLRWLNTAGKAPVALTGKVTLVRWWTDSCPYCTRSLPAITRLQKQFAGQDFQTVGVYHPKPPRAVDEPEFLRAAEQRDYHGAVAVDADWSVLERIYRHNHPGSPTSVSFIVDRSGTVRYVHPGPVFESTDDPSRASANRDYEEIKSVIELLLKK
jgi:thiol-disulfide isomerase/thioredoxin